MKPPQEPTIRTFPRRRFLQAAAIAGATSQWLPSTAAALTLKSNKPSLIDTNVYLDHWPVRHLPLTEPAALEEKLKSHQVTEAWVSSLDSLFHKDLASVNQRIVKTCGKHSIFKPIGAINPTLPRWEEDIVRCAKQHQMRGIRLHPNYHGYKLDDPRFLELLKLATSHRLFVQIACVMEDERTQHPLLRVAPLDLTPLPKALDAAPGTRVMLLNWLRSSGGKPTLSMLKDTSVLFDSAMLEGLAGIESLLEELPSTRIVFGSYAPVFYFESAKLKLQESNLTPAQVDSITHGNAAALVSW